MRPKHSTGAATFEIHMDMKVAVNMHASSTLRGLRPTRERTATAIWAGGGWVGQGGEGRGQEGGRRQETAWDRGGGWGVGGTYKMG